MMKNYVVESYENYKEEDRLSTNNARRIEFLTTVRVLDEWITGKKQILDCAAGTGINSFYLADKGHEVTATDITPRHIDVIREIAAAKPYKMEAQDGATAHFSQKVDNWTEDQFKIWCDYHYSICRQKSLLGASNHVVIIGRK